MVVLYLYVNNVGMDLVQIGRLYLRYGSSSMKTIAKRDQTATDKQPLLFYGKMSQEFC